MSAVSKIVIFCLVAMATASKSDVKAYTKILKDIRDQSTAIPSAQLMWDVIQSGANYYCAISAQGPECKAFKICLLEHELEEGSTQCDVTPKSEPCVQARQLLGPSSDSLSHQELKEAMINEADAIFKDTTNSFFVLDEVRLSVIDMICSTEGEEACANWR